MLHRYGILDDRASLLWATCGGVPLKAHHKLLSQPYSRHEVMSWHRFASIASGSSPASGGDGHQSNSTGAGAHRQQQCFSRCGQVWAVRPVISKVDTEVDTDACNHTSQGR